MIAFSSQGKCDGRGLKCDAVRPGEHSASAVLVGLQDTDTSAHENTYQACQVLSLAYSAPK